MLVAMVSPKKQSKGPFIGSNLFNISEKMVYLNPLSVVELNELWEVELTTLSRPNQPLGDFVAIF